MELTIWHFLIVCPFVFMAGFVDAVAGGGGLISLPAYMISGLPVHQCIATNKMSSSMGTTLTTIRYARNGYIVWKQAIACVVCAIVGSNIGAHLALMLEDGVFKIVMLIVLPLTAIYVLRGKAFRADYEAYSIRKTTLISMPIALIIGAYDGFYGPGTGTFLILLLTGLAHMKLQEANGVTKVINLTTNITSLIVFLMNGKVILILGVTAGLFNIAGNYLGSKSFDKGGAKVVKPVMILVLILFMIKIISDYL